MTPQLLLVLLLVGIGAPAVLGPNVISAAAPALMRTPRLAITLLLGGVASWLLALLALGPILAWVTTGPALLSGSSAATCQRCIAASNPFGTSPATTAVPAAVLLAMPAIGAAALAAAALCRSRRRRDASRALGRIVADTARTHIVTGQQVKVISDDRPMAFTLPARHGGIVVSTGALSVLDNAEFTAVVAHENGHLRQHHHAIMTIIDGIAAPLRKVPLVRAVAEALPHYLEIAADDAARTRASTPALASALLKLSASAPTSHDTAHDPLAAPILHTTGPDRIRHLVTPSGPPSPGARVAAGLGVVGLALLLAAGAAVHAPYVAAAIAGCP